MQNSQFIELSNLLKTQISQNEEANNKIKQMENEIEKINSKFEHIIKSVENKKSVKETQEVNNDKIKIEKDEKIEVNKTSDIKKYVLAGLGILAASIGTYFVAKNIMKSEENDETDNSYLSLESNNSNKNTEDASILTAEFRS